MNSQNKGHLDEILRNLMGSGEIDTPMSDEIAGLFLSTYAVTVPSKVQSKIESEFMVERFKAMIKQRKCFVAMKQAEAMTFGGYLTYVRSALKISSNIASHACRINEQSLLAIENSAIDIFKAPIELIVNILDGFSLPTNTANILMRNTLSLMNEKEGNAVLPRADKKEQGLVGAYEAALLAIRKAGKPSGKSPSRPVDPTFLANIRKMLMERGRTDLLC